MEIFTSTETIVSSHRFKGYHCELGKLKLKLHLHSIEETKYKNEFL